MLTITHSLISHPDTYRHLLVLHIHKLYTPTVLALHVYNHTQPLVFHVHVHVHSH